MSPLEFRILGPLEVAAGEQAVELGRGNERALLAILLLHADEVVSPDRLIDELWGERPPATAREMIRIYVARLRRRFSAAGAADPISTVPAGYVLQLDDHGLDLDRFNRLRAEGTRALEAGDAEHAAEKLGEALSLWRGPPLADFQLSSFAQKEIGRLEELRLATLEDRIEAELELGGAGVLVGELDVLVLEHPYRERLRAAQMLALYRSGRQADALAAYRDARAALGELGLEPGPELRRLELAVLHQDDSLSATGAIRTSVPLGAGSPGRQRSSRRPALIAALALLIGGGALAAVLELRQGQAAPPIHLRPNSVAVVDPSTGQIVGQVRLGNIPGAMVLEGRHLWVVNGVDRTIAEFDTHSLHRLRTIGLPTVPYRITAVPGTLWLGNAFDGTVSRLDVRSGLLSPPFRPEPSSTGRLALATGFGSLWTASQDARIARVEPDTNALEAVIRGPAAPEGLVAGGGSIWAIGRTAGVVARLDPVANTVSATKPLGSSPTAVASDPRSVWVLTPATNTLKQIDPSTGRVVALVEVGSAASGLAVGEGSVWVVSGERGVLLQIDPRKAHVVRSIPVAQPLGQVVAGAGSVWVSVP